MRLVVLELALVYIEVCMDETSLTVGLVRHEVAFVNAAIGLDLSAFALADLIPTHKPLTLVMSMVVHNDHLSFLYLTKLLLDSDIIEYKDSKLGALFLKRQKHKKSKIYISSVRCVYYVLTLTFSLS